LMPATEMLIAAIATTADAVRDYFQPWPSTPSAAAVI